MTGAQEVGTVVGDEFGVVCRDQSMNGLKMHVKDFQFYPKTNGKPLNDFKLGSVMMPFIFEKYHLSRDWKENQNKCLEIRWEVIILVQVAMMASWAHFQGLF